VRETVSRQAALLVTDEWVGYRGLDAPSTPMPSSAYRWRIRSGVAHTNTIEGFWSLFKRQIFGHPSLVSEKHHDQYVGEATWRYKSARGRRRRAG